MCLLPVSSPGFLNTCIEMSHMKAGQMKAHSNYTCATPRGLFYTCLSAEHDTPIPTGHEAP